MLEQDEQRRIEQGRNNPSGPAQAGKVLLGLIGAALLLNAALASTALNYLVPGTAAGRYSTTTNRTPKKQRISPEKNRRPSLGCAPFSRSSPKPNRSSERRLKGVGPAYLKTTFAEESSRYVASRPGVHSPFLRYSVLTNSVPSGRISKFPRTSVTPFAFPVTTSCD